MEYGIWTLIPVLFVIAFALKTKRTLEPLIFGTLLTYVITSAARIPSEGVYALSHIATDWMDAFFRVATDYSHQWVFLVCALFGSLITLLGESHGTLGFTRALGKLCRGPRSTMMVTWIMGILIFVDDYLNIMTLSTCMKKLTDQRRVPREALSYIIDSTGAPVCAQAQSEMAITRHRAKHMHFFMEIAPFIHPYSYKWMFIQIIIPLGPDCVKGI